MQHDIDNLIQEFTGHMQAGRLDEAESTCDKIIERSPNSAMAHYQKGRIALARGEHRQAIERINTAIGMDSNQASFHVDLGVAYARTNDPDEARRCFRQALALTPDDPLLHNNLGTTYKHQGKYREAVECYRTAIAKDRNCKIAYISLGKLFRTIGEPDQATDVFRKAIKIFPDDLDLLFYFAELQRTLGHYRETVGICNEILEKNPDYPDVYNLLGLASARLGRKEEAIDCYNEAIKREPESPRPYNNIGRELLRQNDLAGAISHFRKALAVKPDHAKAHSNLLLTLNYMPEISQEEIFRESTRFGLQQQANLDSTPCDFCRSRDKDKILKIGYVSPDFRHHSVAYFLNEIPRAHERTKTEIFCYSDVEQPDDLTKKFEQDSDHWRSIFATSNEDFAALIRQDGIDILVDLAGHTAKNRLPAFILKPAPIQVTWLGYPNTTGLRSMDYRLTDAIADPLGQSDSYYTETLFRLPHGFLCFQADNPLPSVKPPPSLSRGYITFGNFNNINKASDEAILAWSRILREVPDSRLIMKSIVLTDTEMQCLVDRFTRHGIERDRIDLLGEIPGKIDHLNLYSEVDICLDPFPYNGTATTCEALWMGVPVITLLGDRHAARVGASILHQAGLTDLVAEDKESYIRLARSLARDTTRLATLRDRLRAQMRESELMDVGLFVTDLEAAYRKMWIDWCED